MPKETMFEGNIIERIKLRKEGFNEIKRKEQNINNELFKAYFTDYQSPSCTCRKLSETENTEINRIWADLIKKVLGKLKRIIKNTLKDDAAKIEENEKIIDVVENTLEFNNNI